MPLKSFRCRTSASSLTRERGTRVCRCPMKSQYSHLGILYQVTDLWGRMKLCFFCCKKRRPVVIRYETQVSTCSEKSDRPEITFPEDSSSKFFTVRRRNRKVSKLKPRLPKKHSVNDPTSLSFRFSYNQNTVSAGLSHPKPKETSVSVAHVTSHAVESSDRTGETGVFSI